MVQYSFSTHAHVLFLHRLFRVQECFRFENLYKIQFDLIVLKARISSKFHFYVQDCLDLGNCTYKFCSSAVRTTEKLVSRNFSSQSTRIVHFTDFFGSLAVKPPEPLKSRKSFGHYTSSPPELLISRNFSFTQVPSHPNR